MKKFFTLFFIGLLIYTAFLIFRREKDEWIVDDRGVWVSHGNPQEKPKEAAEQEELVRQAYNMYDNSKSLGVNFDKGPCLGKLSADWVLDIAHNPRTAADDEPKNQCQDFIKGKAKHFIELDPSGEIIQIK
jgi:hypothetical protein